MKKHQSKKTSLFVAIASHPVTCITGILVGLSLLTLVTNIPLSRITQIAIYTLYGAGVNLLVAYTGLVPFGAGLFFGCASYALALSMIYLFGNEIEGLAFAVALSMVIAVVLGALILRRRGLYFSLLTLAASQIAFEIAFKWTSFTGGENGLQNVPRRWVTDYDTLHVVALLAVTAAIFAMWRIVHSPIGRTLQAIRDNEQRAMSLGYNTYLIKLGAFVISAGLIGLGGGLLALLLRGAYADNLGWAHAADALLMTVLGGLHHFMGPLWGAVAFVLLESQLSEITSNWWLIFGPLIIVCALVAPEGIHSLLRRIFGLSGWTLVRNEIPARPEVITPIVIDSLSIDRAKPILTLRGVSKQFGSLVVANDLSLDVYPYQLHSLIGPNGAGKTTLFNMLTGIERPTRGEIAFLGVTVTGLSVSRRARLGLTRSFQIISVFQHLAAFENVRIAVQAQSSRRNNIWRDAYSLDEINARTWSILASVGLLNQASTLCVNLAHGQRRLLDIAMAVAADAKLILLDEPLAGLAQADREVVGRLIQDLARTRAIILIEHDIDRVLAISDRITVLHQGRFIADGPPSSVASNPQVISAYLGRDVRSGTAPDVVESVPRSVVSTPLLELKNVDAGYDGSKVIERLSLRLYEGETVALLGRNGVGKTTALRAITGVIEPTSGDICLGGQSIAGLTPYQINRKGISLVPEGRRLFPNLTVLENLLIAQRANGKTLGEVYELFPRLKLIERSRAESLSGGERQMVAIARALMVPSRVLLLDEPFEGLAPAIVQEVMDTLAKLRGKVAMILVEHHAHLLLPIVDRAVVLVNGCVAFEGSAASLARDHDLQARLLGVVADEKDEKDKSLVAQ